MGLICAPLTTVGVAAWNVIDVAVGAIAAAPVTVAEPVENVMVNPALAAAIAPAAPLYEDGPLYGIVRAPYVPGVGPAPNDGLPVCHDIDA